MYVTANYNHVVSFFTAAFHLLLARFSEFDATLFILEGAVGIPLAPVPRRPQQLRGTLVALGVQDVSHCEGDVQAVGDHGGDGVGPPGEHVPVRLAEQSLRAVGPGVPVKNHE